MVALWRIATSVAIYSTRHGRTNAITDDILLELEKKTSLVELGFQNTEVTAEGVARFKLSVQAAKSTIDLRLS